VVGVAITDELVNKSEYLASALCSLCYVPSYRLSL